MMAIGICYQIAGIGRRLGASRRISCASGGLRGGKQLAKNFGLNSGSHHWSEKRPSKQMNLEAADRSVGGKTYRPSSRPSYAVWGALRRRWS
jgi:hypothetical protein